MKFIKLCLKFYKRVRLPALLLMTVLFIAQLVFVYFTGIYRYCIYTEQKLTDAHIDQSVYVMYMNNPFDVIYAGETLKLQNQIKTMPGVKDILAYKRFLGSTYQGTGQGILFYNDSFLSFFTMDEYGTEVFSDTGLDHNRVQCIAVGPLSDSDRRRILSMYGNSVCS